MAAHKKYFTEEERKNARREDCRRWRDKNKNKEKERLKQWKLDHPIEERMHTLLMAYNTADKKHNRGNGDLTVAWMMDNIAFKVCSHCGKSGWDIMGCNRLDNSKPHTKDNVEPCCGECNKKEWGKERRIQVDQIDKTTGEIIHSWNSTMDVKRSLGFLCSGISRCCMEKQKTHKGYVWKYPS